MWQIRGGEIIGLSAMLTAGCGALFSHLPSAGGSRVCISIAWEPQPYLITKLPAIVLQQDSNGQLERTHYDEDHSLFHCRHIHCTATTQPRRQDSTHCRQTERTTSTSAEKYACETVQTAHYTCGASRAHHLKAREPQSTSKHSQGVYHALPSSLPTLSNDITAGSVPFPSGRTRIIAPLACLMLGATSRGILQSQRESVPAQAASSEQGGTPSTDRTVAPDTNPSLVLWLLSSCAGLGYTANAFAADGELSYDPTQGSQYFESVAGFLYVCLVVWFLTRTISRRVKKFTSEKISSGIPGSVKAGSDNDDLIIQSDQDKAATPVGAISGAALAFVISLALYQGCVRVDEYFDHQTISTQFTVAKLQVTIQTIVRGLVYLCTFTFAANAAGLLDSAVTLPSAGLAVALVVNPDSVKDKVIDRPERDPLLDVTASKPMAFRDTDVTASKDD